MKQIAAIIKPHRLDTVHEALVGLGVAAHSATEIKAFDTETVHAEIHRGKQYNVGFMPMMQITTVVDDDMVDSVVEAIRRASSTGNADDGQIFVCDVQSTQRIHTG